MRWIDTHTKMLLTMIPFVVSSCIEALDPDNIQFDDLLVVEALITDQVTHQEVNLSRTRAINQRAFMFERGATVWTEDANGVRVRFNELSAGTYTSEVPFAAPVGSTLQLFIETDNGRQYQSSVMEVLPTDPIDSLYATFTSEPVNRNTLAGRISFFIDANANPSLNRYFRWNWNYTYEFSTSTPSRWIFKDNEFINRDRGGENDSLQVEVCWQTFEDANLNLLETKTPQIGIQALPIFDFHSEEGYMKKGLSMELTWYALPRSSYNYWNLISDVSQDQGSLADKQPGSIVGNIRSTSNPSEIVLGQFDVAQVKVVRRFFDREDFFEAGFRVIRGDLIDCLDFPPVNSDKTPEAVDSTLNVLGDDWVLSYFGTGGAFFLPRRCAECTEFGTNKRPQFWE